jgi:putative membrane protein
MKMGTFAGALVALAATVAAAPALPQQTGNPAVMSPDTPRTDVLPADHPNTVDQLFARQALIGGHAEVELAKLAATRAQSQAVKQFAQRMVDDHGKANNSLVSLAKANRAALPKSADVDPDAKAVRMQLEKLRGADFDVAYMAVQIGDHQKTAHLLEHEIGAGQDAKMKDYAKQTLPTVMLHLESAREIHSALVAGAPRAPAGAGD